MRVGLLALQGAFAAHARPLAELGHATFEARTPEEIAEADGLVLPGGESSVHLALIERLRLRDALLAFGASGRPVLAVCAGLILAAREVSSPEQASLALLDVAVVRNAYGRQRQSFVSTSDDGALELVFIRAPRLARVGPEVCVLATHRREPVLVRQGNVTGAAFHPELTTSLAVHRAAFE
ncbi:MAG TPA: pyridoxal 5'-phosphate synthase glutaminase subunit PdxT [Polyangiaceae bacterium]|nr:pyridoxal 5'-phosphate synthase glutaminase subunit PdxT [Polyangiaceae bacterium]